MSSLLVEPGFWVATILIVAIANKAIGAALNRRDFARLNELARAELAQIQPMESGPERAARQRRLSEPLIAVSHPISGLGMFLTAPAFTLWMSVVIVGAAFRPNPVEVIDRALWSRRTPTDIDRLAGKIAFKLTPLGALWLRAWLLIPGVLGWVVTRSHLVVRTYLTRGFLSIIRRTGHHA